MELRAVTANLGCGGPRSGSVDGAAVSWLEDEAERGTDLLFLQEVPVGAEAALAERYDTHGVARSWRSDCQSIVAIRRESQITSEAFDLGTSRYHRSWLAAARLELPGGHSFVAVSVHASPTRVRDDDLAEWEGDVPEPRPPSRGQLWDADLVAATLTRVADQHSVLAAGDLNESRLYDEHVGRPWAAEYFARLRDAGLFDATYGRWGDRERPTRGEFQDDHVLATAEVDRLIRIPVVQPGCGSDHLPVAWMLEP